MPIFKGNSFSIVLIGRQNPQILNHDFLDKNNILPKETEPFKTLLKENPTEKNFQPFSEYISTPVLTSIRYGVISIIVEENRFQIRDNRFEDIISNPIIQITKNYFRILKYTPLKIGGINLNGILEFSDKEDEKSFDKNLGFSNNIEINGIDTTDMRISVTFTFPWNNGTIEIGLPKLKDKLKGKINFNYEFKYKDIDQFLKNLDDISQVYEKLSQFLQSLNIN